MTNSGNEDRRLDDLFWEQIESLEFLEFAVRVLFPISLTFISWIIIKGGKNNGGYAFVRYVPLSVLFFTFGIIGFSADLSHGVSYIIKHGFGSTSLVFRLEHFIKREADNLVFITVGISLIAAMDAISTTANDIKQSESVILARLSKNEPPKVDRATLWQRIIWWRKR